MDEPVDAILRFIETHEAWVTAIVFAASFLESLVIVSLLVPGTAILFAVGTLVPDTVPPVPPMIAAIAGAMAGDGLSYWLGRRYRDRLARVWPFTRHPKIIPDGIAFFARYGGASVFVGRFFGPVRAAVPLAAGLMGMAPRPFWIVNVASALVWAPLMLFGGALLGEVASSLGAETKLALIVGGGFVLGLGGLALFNRQRKE